MQFSGYILGKLPSAITSDLAALFTLLPPDIIDYKSNGFQSRFRCFGAFRGDGEGFAPDINVRDRFNHKKKFHTDNRDRHPAPLPQEALQEGLIERLLKTIFSGSPLKSHRGYLYGVNLIRVTANDDFMGAPAPGLHQDGYDYSCHINIARNNVSGGASIIAETSSPETTVLDHELQPGEYVFFNDRTLHHTATPVTPRYGGHPTWRDMIIIDFIEDDRAFSHEEPASIAVEG
ncbi:2OG-Fe dioxygenase family protein [Sphingobium sp.]|uniref:2OG-Fe dioxygenase family protein n=1 Tax=Sphingobium sp. TaxID=1912891 RepID=UPI000DB52159|nr:2OG-Fe dioxygenase family protein [Sphingobium sp.]PZU68652.1 MAG: hypothetical protein DI540_07840 [Sphingobium sp.]